MHSRQLRVRQPKKKTKQKKKQLSRIGFSKLHALGENKRKKNEVLIKFIYICTQSLKMALNMVKIFKYAVGPSNVE